MILKKLIIFHIVLLILSFLIENIDSTGLSRLNLDPLYILVKGINNVQKIEGVFLRTVFIGLDTTLSSYQ